MKRIASLLSLFAAAATALGAVSDGSTVTGTISDLVGSSTTVKVTFTPLTAPMTLDGSWVVSGRPKTYTATNGAISLWLNAGQYQVTVGATDKFKIDVPTGGGTNDIGSVTTSGIVWVPPGAGGGTNGTSYSTSAQLAADVLDETGTGQLVMSGSPVLSTPQIADFSSATHDHQSASKGGSLNAAAIASGTLPMSRGGTGSSMTDPNASRLLGWDDSEGYIKWWTLGNGFAYDDATDTLNFTAAGTGDVLAGNTLTNLSPLLGASGKTLIATNAAAFRSVIGVAVGLDVLAYDSDLGSLSGGITGIVKGGGNGAGYSAAVAGSDYLSPSSNTSGDRITSGTVGEPYISSAIARRADTPYGTNMWHLWAVGTNSYIARRGSGDLISSNDFAGLMQYAYDSSADEKVHFKIMPSFYGGTNFLFTHTVEFTNYYKSVITEGHGNPSTILVPSATMTPGTPMFRLGSTNHTLTTIAEFRELRFAAGLGGFGAVGTNTITGVLAENCSEPVFDRCEFTQLYNGIDIATPTSCVWGYADNCWFVCSTNVNSSGIVFSSNPSTACDFRISNSKFAVYRGAGIRLAGGFDNVLMPGNTFDGGSTPGIGIKVTAGTNLLVSSSSFVGFVPTATPIVFDARGSSTDVRAGIVGNTLAGGCTTFVTTGANVTGIEQVGNRGLGDAANWTTAGTVTASEFIAGATASAGTSNTVVATTAYADRAAAAAAGAAAPTNYAVLNVGTLNLTNAVGVAAGGTARSTITAGSLLSGNGTGTPDLVTIGSGLSLSGSAGDGTRTLTATASSGSASNVFSVSADNFATNATPTCVWTQAVSTASTLRAFALVTLAGPTNSASYETQGVFKRGSGNVSAVGTATNVIGEDASGMDAYWAADTSAQAAKLWVVGLTNEQFHVDAEGWTKILTNHVVTASGCATTDTSIPHDTFIEGFQTASTGYQDGNSATATEVGTTANIDSYADSSSLTTGKPDGACDRAAKFTLPNDGTETYTQVTLASAIDPTATDIDIHFAFYVESGPGVGLDYRVFATSQDSALGNLQTSVLLENSSGQLRLRATSSANSSPYNISSGQWYSVIVHLDQSDAATSYLEVNGDSANRKTFTRNATRTVAYLYYGSPGLLEAGDESTVLFDLVCVNTP